MQTVGDRIRERRKELGLTQGELATRMGYKSKSAVCKAETVEFNPTLDRVKEFAKALDTTPSYLMGWDTGDTKRRPFIADEISSDGMNLVIEKANKLDKESLDHAIAYLDFLLSQKK